MISWQCSPLCGRSTSSHREISGLSRPGHRVGPTCYNRNFMVQLFLAVLGALQRFLPFSKRHCPGDPRSAPASRRTQAPATAAAPARWGPVVLDDSPPLLVPLGRGPPHCQTRDCGRLASRRFSTLLALAAASARRTAKDHATGQDLIGRLTKQNPEWGAPKIQAGLIPHGTNGGPISESYGSAR
jgi:hypothetical protein